MLILMHFLTLRVVTLGPVVASTRLAKDKVVRPEELPIGPSPDRVHGAGLKIKKDGSGDVFAHAGLVVVDVDPLELQVRCAIIISNSIDAMLIRDDLPELKCKKKINF